MEQSAFINKQAELSAFIYKAFRTSFNDFALEHSLLKEKIEQKTIWVQIIKRQKNSTLFRNQKFSEHSELFMTLRSESSFEIVWTLNF